MTGSGEARLTKERSLTVSRKHKGMYIKCCMRGDTMAYKDQWPSSLRQTLPLRPSMESQTQEVLRALAD